MCVIASEGLPPGIALLLLSHCFIRRFRHPLFPLMAMFFEKCEQATQTPDCPSSDCFDVDIQAFVLRQEQEHKAFFSDDPELDGLVCITCYTLLYFCFLLCNVLGFFAFLNVASLPTLPERSARVMHLRVCLSVWTCNSKSIAPIDFDFLHNKYYTHGSVLL